jgi:hypothetical protein
MNKDKTVIIVSFIVALVFGYLGALMFTAIIATAYGTSYGLPGFLASLSIVALVEFILFILCRKWIWY